MKKVLAILKRHWMVLSMAVIVLAAVPAMMWFSGSMGAKQLTDIQSKVDADLKDMANGSPRVSYALPGATPGSPAAVELSAPPNTVLTNWFKERREKQQAQLNGLVGRALEFNRGARKPLVDGLFPEPSRAEKQTKPLEFARAYTEVATADLLKRINAGAPPEPTALAMQVSESNDQKRVASGAAQLPPDEEAKLREELVKLRKSKVQARASEIAVYAEPSVFVNVPKLKPEDPPRSLRECWDWQQQHWAHESLIEAVRLANEQTAGEGTGVLGAAVKRLVSIVVDKPMGARQTEEDSGEARAAPAGGGGGEGAMKPNYRASITGRVAGPRTSNDMYDIRTARVEAIVSAKHLPAVIDAISKSNFMTVTKLDLEKVEPLDEMKNGFYYGDEAVVKARFQIETVWMREWMKPWMPAEVKKSLGIKDEPKPEDDKSGKGGG
ncbi:MAG: hypothetical protein JNM07_01625 [Phycisphaerae bacterium]|nr:hypothetical protein [Phycisphaerae bacterium]